jgi:hypothetical protein
MKLVCVHCFEILSRYTRNEACPYCGGFLVLSGDCSEMPNMLKLVHRQDLLDSRQPQTGFGVRVAM